MAIVAETVFCSFLRVKNSALVIVEPSLQNYCSKGEEQFDVFE